MNEVTISRGEGRVKVVISARFFGNDVIVSVCNEGAHVGSVAVSEYDFANQRASTSVLTRFGHKEDIVARRAAYEVCKASKKAVCAIAGIHLEGITNEEIKKIQENAFALVEELARSVFLSNEKGR